MCHPAILVFLSDKSPLLPQATREGGRLLLAGAGSDRTEANGAFHRSTACLYPSVNLRRPFIAIYVYTYMCEIIWKTLRNSVSILKVKMKNEMRVRLPVHNSPPLLHLRVLLLLFSPPSPLSVFLEHAATYFRCGPLWQLIHIAWGTRRAERGSWNCTMCQYATPPGSRALA